MYSEEKTNRIKLTDTSQYLRLLKIIEEKSGSIMLVSVTKDDDSFNKILQIAFNTMPLIEKKEVNRWIGTRRGGTGVNLYHFKTTTAFFRYLRKLQGFFFNAQNPRGYSEVIFTNFGYGDIAFMGRNGEVVFFTVTHEGYALLAKSIKF